MFYVLKSAEILRQTANFNSKFYIFHPKKATKKRQKKATKGDKKATNCRLKNRELEKSDKTWISFWSVAAHPRPLPISKKQAYGQVFYS